MEQIIDILLSTFNGQKYLKSLLDSIALQNFKFWRLIIRDDGSTDNSKEIINLFRKKHPEKVLTINDEKGNLGPKYSYSELLKYSNAHYKMFCDQDDIWFPDKIKLTYDTMKEYEIDPSIPLLIYTDLIVVNEILNPISRSFFKFQNINVHLDNNMYYLFYKNPAPGCTIMINHAAAKAILPIGSNAIMHDWWITIGCKIKGKVVCLNKPTALYRQHQYNLLGAEKIKSSSSLSYLARLLLSPRRLKKVIRRHKQFISQAKEAGFFFGFQFIPRKYFLSIFYGKVISPFLSYAGLIDRNKVWRYK
jgi:glycosyltransferase involved in cell wall biosynthesis